MLISLDKHEQPIALRLKSRQLADLKKSKDKISHFEKACRDAGLKITHQRLEIFRELASALDHPSAETLYKRLADKLPTVSLDTVYRTLNTLEEHNLVIRVETQESQGRFEAEMSPHHHIICNQCGKITDFECKDVDQDTIACQVRDWGEINRLNITLHGLCRECSG